MGEILNKKRGGKEKERWGRYRTTRTCPLPPYLLSHPLVTCNEVANLTLTIPKINPMILGLEILYISVFPYVIVSLDIISKSLEISLMK